MPLIFCPTPSLSQIQVRPSGASLGAASIHLTGAVRNGQAIKVTFLNGLIRDAMNAGASLSLAVEVRRGVARTLTFYVCVTSPLKLTALMPRPRHFYGQNPYHITAPVAYINSDVCATHGVRSAVSCSGRRDRRPPKIRRSAPATGSVKFGGERYLYDDLATRQVFQ